MNNNPEVMDNKIEGGNEEVVVTPEMQEKEMVKTEAPTKKKGLFGITSFKDLIKKVNDAAMSDKEKAIAKMQAEQKAKKEAYMKETGKSEKEMYEDVRIKGQQEVIADIEATGDTDRAEKLKAFYAENPNSTAHWDSEKRVYTEGKVGQSNFSQDHY